jgi:hypothetical protein
LTLPSLSPLPLDVSQQTLFNFLKSNYKAREGNWDENYYPVHASEGLTLRINAPFLPASNPRESIHLLLNCSLFGQEYNSISFLIDMGNKIRDEKYIDIQKQIIELYSTISSSLIKSLSPDYVWMGEEDEMYQRIVELKCIIKREVKYIGWANYFDSLFLKENERQIFINSPVGVCYPQENGFWYFLHKDFLDLSDEEMLAIENQADNYFSQHFNLDWIQWRFVSL